MALDYESAKSPFQSTRVPGRGRGWYRGDCHVHSRRSSGAELTPEELADAARAIGLDFLAATEHNSADTHDAWTARASEDLLVILGQESTTPAGHWLALGIDPGQVIDWRYGVDDGQMDQQLRLVHEAGGICVAAHPHAPYPSGAFLYPYSGFDAVEVWNGPWTSDQPWNADNEAALAEWHRSLAAAIPGMQWQPAMGNSDTHLAGQIGVPHTVVLAEELSTAAILAGIRAGRSWIAGSTATGLSVEVLVGDRRANLGERLATLGQIAAVRVSVRGVPSATVSFHTERGVAHRASLGEDGTGVLEWCTSADECAFVRVEVRHPGGRMAALTNPVLFV